MHPTKAPAPESGVTSLTLQISGLDEISVDMLVQELEQRLKDCPTVVGTATVCVVADSDTIRVRSRTKLGRGYETLQLG